MALHGHHPLQAAVLLHDGDVSVTTTTKYRIRRMVNGEERWSTGGTEPKWVKEGRVKTWNTLGQLKSHLAQFVDYKGQNNVPADWEVVPVTVVISSGVAVSAHEMAEVKAEKNRERRQQNLSWQERQERENLTRLQKKYPDQRLT